MVSRLLVLLSFLLMVSCGLTNEEEKKLSGFFQRAQSYQANGKLIQALDQVDRGLELDPENTQFIMLKGYIVMARFDQRQSIPDLDDACALFRQAATAGIFSQARREALLGLGRCLQKLSITHRNWARRVDGRLKAGLIRHSEEKETARRIAKRKAMAITYLREARSVFNELLERNPEDIHVIYHLALVKINLGQKEAGAELLKKYIPIARQRRERILGPEMDRTYTQKDREKKLAVARSLRVRLVESLGLLANICFEEKSYAEAAKLLSEVLELNPNRSQEYFNRGRCYYELGEKRKALADLRIFVGRSTLPQEDLRIKEAIQWLTELETKGE